jgi:hypothetical protein
MAPAQVAAIPTRQNDGSDKLEPKLVTQSALEKVGERRRPLEDKSDPSVLYLHPARKKALRLYAVEKGLRSTTCYLKPSKSGQMLVVLGP